MSEEQLRKDDIQGQIVHVYDGIEEADNELPTWWLVTLFASILFSAFYWMYYESLSVGDYPEAAYTKERLAALEGAGEVTDADLLALVNDAPMVSAGKSLFFKNCTKCHGSNAGGKDGPNLTDKFWLYGGAPSDIYNTITNGTKNGMASWGPKLGAGAVKQVAAYVITLRNTNVAGKAPQGDEWIPSEAPAAPEPEAEVPAPAPSTTP